MIMPGEMNTLLGVGWLLGWLTESAVWQAGWLWLAGRLVVLDGSGGQAGWLDSGWKDAVLDPAAR